MIHTNPGTRNLIVDKEPITPDVLMSYLKKMAEFGTEYCPRLETELFPIFIIKLGYSTSSNSVRLFYSVKQCYMEIIDHWGWTCLAVQRYLYPKTKKASILRLEYWGSNNIKTNSITNQNDISEVRDRILPIISGANEKTFLEMSIIERLGSNKFKQQVLKKLT